MAAVSMENICWAVISGIEKAQIDYEEMSGGEWLWTAAEYMLTTYIAKEIHELEGSKFVTVESNGLSTMDFAGARAPGPKPRKARLSGRFDLLVWWANSKPRGVIEVKNQPGGPSGWYHDIDRITSVLDIGKGDSSIKFGSFVYYYSARDGSRYSAEEKVDAKFRRVEALVKERTKNKYRVRQVVSEIHNEGELGAWGAACLTIQPA